MPDIESGFEKAMRSRTRAEPQGPRGNGPQLGGPQFLDRIDMMNRMFAQPLLVHPVKQGHNSVPALA